MSNVRHLTQAEGAQLRDLLPGGTPEQRTAVRAQVLVDERLAHLRPLLVLDDVDVGSVLVST